jgi:hypothetical protein
LGFGGWGDGSKESWWNCTKVYSPYLLMNNSKLEQWKCEN